MGNNRSIKEAKALNNIKQFLSKILTWTHIFIVKNSRIKVISTNKQPLVKSIFSYLQYPMNPFRAPA